MNLEPLSDKILVTRESAPAKSTGGIIIPDQAKSKVNRGAVVAVGPEVKYLKEGDKVLFGKFSPNEVDYLGNKYLLMSEEDVSCKIKG